LALVLLVSPAPALSWTNGQPGNASTDQPAECSKPPYSTHDWIAEHALALLPDDEKVWLVPHKAMYLLGTEAPDNRLITVSCKSPHRGYDDRSQGHNVRWSADFKTMTKDRAPVRAQEEYNKAALAFRQGSASAAAFYLGAMAHYIGDLAQYGHIISDPQFHSPYERWAAQRTGSVDAGHFERYIEGDGLVRRSAFTAGKRIALAVGRGKGKILPATEMLARFNDKDDVYLDSVGTSLNLAVNELADVLHTFFLNVVREDDEND
jgi:hypothetical protein